ncbi:dual specificity protein phosphatase 3-like [Biomphalaria glabrata]|uniref:Dual specificity protein phosphatase n=1 Tax=Biomphalaria glabrata TaxID=6526 RepID=A0A9U8EPA8_BIOGL|nr:dual specificity protein phosphatase 3-like [Biomphalaria glabrata]XP_055870548.1 dual specificity protein phosphatase 3-like [Biomphalaria glabrata]
MGSNDAHMFEEAKLFLANYKDVGKPNKSRAPVVNSFSYFIFPSIPHNACDEIEPGLWLGNGDLAKKLDALKDMKVTHVVNACMGNKLNQVDTNADYYQAANIHFYGIPAVDLSSFNIIPFLRPAADYIEQALANKGIVLVHCQLGISRSASLVIAYLMLKRNMDFKNAVQYVRQRREIFPNDGFLKQLILLNREIVASKVVSQEKPAFID